MFGPLEVSPAEMRTCYVTQFKASYMTTYGSSKHLTSVSFWEGESQSSNFKGSAHSRLSFTIETNCAVPTGLQRLLAICTLIEQL